MRFIKNTRNEHWMKIISFVDVIYERIYRISWFAMNNALTEGGVITFWPRRNQFLLEWIQNNYMTKKYVIMF